MGHGFTKDRRGSFMAFMTVLKVIFTLLLCVPLVYLMIYFLMKLIDEVVRQNKGGTPTGKKKNRSRRR